MTVKRILITSDDGYNAIGIRILVRALKGTYDLAIAATKCQQSGVGGHITVSGGSWGKTTVEGVPALWVDGYPVDAVECASQYYKKPFDVVISGINWGLNVGWCFVTSGTMAAAARSFGIGLTKYAIAISWQAPSANWTQQYNGNENINAYASYPGACIRRLTDKAFKQNFWGAQYLGINLPAEPTTKAVFTTILPNHNRYYHQLELHRETHTYQYPHKKALRPDLRKQFDAGAVLSGVISITPLLPAPVDWSVYDTMKGKRIAL